MLVAHENFARIVQLAKDSELIQGTEEVRTDEIDEIANIISVQPKTVEEVKKILDLTPSFTTQITAEATKTFNQFY